MKPKIYVALKFRFSISINFPVFDFKYILFITVAQAIAGFFDGENSELCPAKKKFTSRSYIDN